MTSPVYGFIFNQTDTDDLSPVQSDFSVLGIVLPSDDALNSVFPLNVPVDINTGATATLAAAGTGPLYQTLTRINAQLADLQVSARAVVVRVPMGLNQDGTENVAQTIANIVGDPGQGTGLYALLKAPSLLGPTPRLIGSPGYTGAIKYAVTAPVILTQGTGYTNPVVTFSPTGAAATAVQTGGHITAINLTSPGNYDPGTTVTATIADSGGGTGTGATMSIELEALANSVCAALPQILNALLAHSIVGGPGTTKQAAIDWWGTLSSQRIIPVDNWEIIQSGTGTAYIDGAASALGIAVRTDFQHGGLPFWSFAGQPVQGLLGLKRIDALSLTDGATDGQELLAVGIGVTARGDLADTSVANSGFILVCFNNASTDTNFNLFNKTRGRDYENLQLLKSLRQRLGKDNVTPHQIQAVLNDMDAININLKNQECVIGFTVGFSATGNTTAALRQGRFRVFDNSEEPAPILQITIDRGLDSDALADEIATLASGTNNLSG